MDLLLTASTWITLHLALHWVLDPVLAQLCHPINGQSVFIFLDVGQQHYSGSRASKNYLSATPILFGPLQSRHV